MAAWQCDFYIVPKERVKFGEMPNYDGIPSWKKKSMPIEAVNALEKFLPIEKSWSKDIIQYGELESTCMEIFSISDEEVDIFLRLDLSKLTSNIYDAILRFILDCNCVIYVVSTNKTYAGDENGLKQVIKESLAYRLGIRNNSFIAKL